MYCSQSLIVHLSTCGLRTKGIGGVLLGGFVFEQNWLLQHPLQQLVMFIDCSVVLEAVRPVGHYANISRDVPIVEINSIKAGAGISVVVLLIWNYRYTENRTKLWYFNIKLSDRTRNAHSFSSFPSLIYHWASGICRDKSIVGVFNLFLMGIPVNLPGSASFGCVLLVVPFLLCLYFWTIGHSLATIFVGTQFAIASTLVA